MANGRLSRITCFGDDNADTQRKGKIKAIERIRT